MTKMKESGFNIPRDVMNATQLQTQFPNFKPSYIRYLLRQKDAPIIMSNGQKMVSLSKFQKWYDYEYNGRFSERYIEQQRRVRSYLLTHETTRAELESVLGIRIPNICRIVANLKKDATHDLKIVRISLCPITGHKAEFITLIRKVEQTTLNNERS